MKNNSNIYRFGPSWKCTSPLSDLLDSLFSRTPGSAGWGRRGLTSQVMLTWPHIGLQPVCLPARASPSPSCFLPPRKLSNKSLRDAPGREELGAGEADILVSVLIHVVIVDWHRKSNWKARQGPHKAHTHPDTEEEGKVLGLFTFPPQWRAEWKADSTSGLCSLGCARLLHLSS